MGRRLLMANGYVGYLQISDLSQVSSAGQSAVVVISTDKVSR